MTTGGSAVDNFDSMHPSRSRSRSRSRSLSRSRSRDPSKEYCTCNKGTTCICNSQISVKLRCPTHDPAQYLVDARNSLKNEYKRRKKVIFVFLMWAKKMHWGNDDVLQKIFHHVWCQVRMTLQKKWPGVYSYNQSCSVCGGKIFIRCPKCYSGMDETHNNYNSTFTCLGDGCRVRFVIETPLDDPLSPSLLNDDTQSSLSLTHTVFLKPEDSSDVLSDESLSDLFSEWYNDTRAKSLVKSLRKKTPHSFLSHVFYRPPQKNTTQKRKPCFWCITWHHQGIEAPILFFQDMVGFI